MSTASERPPSLVDVARVAGVSPSTASKALNDRTDVKRATKERVVRIARELGYSPNPVARALGQGPTGTVGVVTSDLEGRFALPMLMGVEDALGADRVLTFLCDARGDDMREAWLVQTLLERRVDGIIIVGRQPDPRPSLGRLSVPVVYAYSESDDPLDTSITVDNTDVGRRAAEHLLSLGRTRIAHISGEPDHSASVRRLEGFQAALDAAGVGMAGPPLFGNWSEGWGRAAMGRALSEAPDLDAVFCASDQIARGAIDVLHDRGIGIPDQIAVIGVDNWKVLAENARVPLSTVDLQLKRLGRVAAARLMAAMAGRPAPGLEQLGSRVCARESTIPLR